MKDVESYILGIDPVSKRLRKPFRMECYSNISRERLYHKIQHPEIQCYYCDAVLKNLNIVCHDDQEIKIRVLKCEPSFIDSLSYDKWDRDKLFKNTHVQFSIDVEGNTISIHSNKDLSAVRWALLLFCDLIDLGASSFSIHLTKSQKEILENILNTQFVIDVDFFNKLKVPLSGNELQIYSRIQGYIIEGEIWKPDLYRTDATLLSDLYSDMCDVYFSKNQTSIEITYITYPNVSHNYLLGYLARFGFQELEPQAGRWKGMIDQELLSSLTKAMQIEDNSLRPIIYPHHYFWQTIDEMGGLVPVYVGWSVSKGGNPNNLASFIYTMLLEIWGKPTLVDNSKDNIITLEYEGKGTAIIWVQKSDEKFYVGSNMKLFNLFLIQFY